MARRGAFDDLMDVASKLPWQVSVVLAAVSALVLHALAASLSGPSAAGSPTAMGGLVARSLYGTIAALLQFIIPLGLLVGALASLLKRSHAKALFTQARSAPERTVTAITWGEFERLIGEAFHRQGYAVSEMGGGGTDGGVDLVLDKDNKRFLVQCKQWRTQRVGVTTIRELNGVMAARKAAGGFVVTCGDYTSEAQRFAQECGIELIDGAGLRSFIREVDRAGVENAAMPRQVDCEPASFDAPSLAARCPKCGSAMTRRTAKRGPHTGRDFLGCTKYPVCRGIRPVERTSGRRS